MVEVEGVVCGLGVEDDSPVRVEGLIDGFGCDEKKSEEGN